MAVVLILGGTSDMGLATAGYFAKNGYQLQLAARDISKLQSVQSDFKIRYAVQTDIYQFDASAVSSHRQFYEALNPKPDIVICVIGYNGSQSLAERDWQEAEKIIVSNYLGLVSVLNIIADDFEGKTRGVIAGVASVAGLRGRQTNYLYGSAKAGFINYLSGLRNRLARKNVHVITVIPGYVKTRMTAGMDLPALLLATPEAVGKKIFSAVKQKKNVVYTKGIWKWIMLFIRFIPEPLFKKMKL
jgi:short-subunit dehydrogenase